MKPRRIVTILFVVVCLMLCGTGVVKGAVMGTAFTYNGRLVDSNLPADGPYDFQFKLFDANIIGGQLGDDINVPDFNVVDGYFTVILDFVNPNAFNGDARWLEIGVRPGAESDPCVFQALLPKESAYKRCTEVGAETISTFESF